MSEIRNYIRKFVSANITIVFGALFAVIGSNLLSIFLSLSVGLFYDIYFQSGSSKGMAVRKLFPGIHDMQGFAILFISLTLLKLLFTFWGKYSTGITGEKLTKDLREILFEKQMQHSLTSFQRKKPGNYLLRYSGDLSAIQQFVNKGVLVFTGDIFLLAATMIVLIFMEYHLGIAVMSVWLAGGIATYFLSRIGRKHSESRRNQRSGILSFVSIRFQHFQTIKAFNRERPETLAFKKLSIKMYELGKKYQFVKAGIQSLFPLFFQGAIGIVLWLIVCGIDMNKSNTLVFILLIFYMQGAFRRVFQVNMIWQNGKVSFRKLFELLNLPMEERPEEGIERIAARKIIFRNVHFTFQEQNRLIEDLSFQLPTEGISLITGGTEYEKSAVLRLMLKLYLPDSGEIFLDQLPYSELTPFEVRKHIAIISADFPVLGNTVFQAITYQAVPEKRTKALEWLRLLGFRNELSDDQLLNLPMKNLATHFSKEELMLLQWARALLTNKKILLLDDPFRFSDQRNCQLMINILQEQAMRKNIVLATDHPPEGLKIDNTILL
jgi:ABC-type multidrug transport system fused ATPase/permease subunit